MTARMHIVTETAAGGHHLVKAGSQAQAQHRSGDVMLSVNIARPMEIAAPISEGAAVLDATAPMSGRGAE